MALSARNSAPVQSEAEYVWVLDPIDGTKSFIAGMPVWGQSYRASAQWQPVYGMMVQPFTRERFTGDGRARFGAVQVPTGG